MFNLIINDNHKIALHTFDHSFFLISKNDVNSIGYFMHEEANQKLQWKNKREKKTMKKTNYKSGENKGKRGENHWM